MCNNKSEVYKKLINLYKTFFLNIDTSHLKKFLYILLAHSVTCSKYPWTMSFMLCLDTVYNSNKPIETSQLPT